MLRLKAMGAVLLGVILLSAALIWQANTTSSIHQHNPLFKYAAFGLYLAMVLALLMPRR